MNYEEKYKQALKRARIGLHDCNLLDCDDMTRRAAITTIYNLFPELAEDEDERIRKKLICFVENWEKYNPNSPFDDYAVYTSDSGECDKILAWLEKQGKKLDADKVIEWLNHHELSRDDVVTSVVPDDSPTSVPHKVKWFSDGFMKQFKKDFGL